MNRASLFALSISVALFSGCASIGSSCADRYGIMYEAEDIVPKLDIKATLDSMARELCCNSDMECSTQKSVLVTDFADIETLEPNRVGLFLGEVFRGSLGESCKYSITQAEFSKYFKLNQSGLVVLSRDSSEIKNSEVGFGTKSMISSAIVGTYKYTPSVLYLFVKEINIDSGKIVKQVTREIPFSCIGNRVLEGDFIF